MQSSHRACLGGLVKVGSGLGLDRPHSHPPDILVNTWHLGKPADFDLTITSPLNPTTLTEAGVRCGSSALVAEARKHNANDAKGAELGWVCITLAVESYGCWGTEGAFLFSKCFFICCVTTHAEPTQNISCLCYHSIVTKMEKVRLIAVPLNTQNHK